MFLAPECNRLEKRQMLKPMCLSTPSSLCYMVATLPDRGAQGRSERVQRIQMKFHLPRIWIIISPATWSAFHLEQDAIQPKSSQTEPWMFLFDVKWEDTCQSCVCFNVCLYTELALPLSNLPDPTSSLSSRFLSLEWRGPVLWTGILEAQTHVKTNKPFLSAILPLNFPSALKTCCECRHMFLKRHSFVLLISM